MMNVEIRYFIIVIHIKRQSETIPSLAFEILYSIFDICIAQQLICGANDNFKHHLFGSALSRVGFFL
jgi:hypothetical protein